MSVYIHSTKKKPVFYVALCCLSILFLTGVYVLTQDQELHSIHQVASSPQVIKSPPHEQGFSYLKISNDFSNAERPYSWRLTPEQKRFIAMEEDDLAHDFAIFRAYGFDLGSSLSSYYGSAFQVAYALHQEGAAEKYSSLFLQLKNPVFFTFLMDRVFDFDTWDTRVALSGDISAPALSPLSAKDIELLSPNQRMDIIQNPHYHAIFLRNMSSIYSLIKNQLAQQSYQYIQMLDQIPPESLTHDDKHSLSDIPAEELDAYLTHSRILTSRYLYRPVQEQITGSYQNLMTILTHESDLSPSLREQQIQALQNIYNQLQ